MKWEIIVKGSLYYSWIDIKFVLFFNDEEVVFEECVCGEKNSFKIYNKLLENIFWLVFIKMMVLC